MDLLKVLQEPVGQEKEETVERSTFSTNLISLYSGFVFPQNRSSVSLYWTPSPETFIVHGLRRALVKELERVSLESKIVNVIQLSFFAIMIMPLSLVFKYWFLSFHDPLSSRFPDGLCDEQVYGNDCRKKEAGKKRLLLFCSLFFFCISIEDDESLSQTRV